MATTTSTFSNDSEDLLLIITTKIGKLSDLIDIKVQVLDHRIGQIEVLYDGHNLSDAIDIFNNNL